MMPAPLAAATIEGCCAIAFVVGVIGGIVGLALWFQSSRQAAWRDAAGEVLRRWDGEVIRGDWLVSDRATFRVEGIEATLTSYQGSKNNPAHTTVQFQLSLPHRLRVTPQDIFLSVRKLFGAQDIEVGDPEFDPEFQVSSDRPTFAIETLTPPVRSSLLRLRPDRPRLEIRPGSVELRIHRFTGGDVDRLRAFVDAAVSLVRGLKAAATPPPAPTPGVDIVEVRAESGNCLTCGTALDGTAVSCAKCGTAQHRDCWTYVGGCSTYACGGTKIRRR